MFYISNIILSLLTSILFLNIVLYLLDNLKLSENKWIYLLQVGTPVWLILSILTLIYMGILTYHDGLIMHLDNNDSKAVSNTIKIGGSLEIKKEAVETLMLNVGLPTTVVGVAGAVSRVVSKSSLPPLPKVGIVLASAALGGSTHLAITNINKVLNKSTTNEGWLTFSTHVSKDSPIKIKNISKSNFLPFTEDNSELMNVLLSLDIITYSCLMLIISLSSMILFKFFLKEEIIKFEKIIGNKLNSYLIFLIKLNKKTYDIYIIIILILLIIGIGFNFYVLTELSNNLDKFVYFHINK